MADTEFKDLALADPLSEVTRRERKLLLGLSVVSLIVVKTGLIPTKISALGVELSITNQQSLLSLFSLVLCYFLTAFLIYGVSDFMGWHRAIRRQREQFEKERLIRERQGDDEDLDWKAHLQVRERGPLFLAYVNPTPVSYLRAALEFGLPIVFGAYSIYVLQFAELARPVTIP